MTNEQFKVAAEPEDVTPEQRAENAVAFENKSGVAKELVKRSVEAQKIPEDVKAEANKFIDSLQKAKADLTEKVKDLKGKGKEDKYLALAGELGKVERLLTKVKDFNESAANGEIVPEKAFADLRGQKEEMAAIQNNLKSLTKVAGVEKRESNDKYRFEKRVRDNAKNIKALFEEVGKHWDYAEFMKKSVNEKKLVVEELQNIINSFFGIEPVINVDGLFGKKSQEFLEIALSKSAKVESANDVFRKETEKHVRRGNIPESTQVGIKSAELNEEKAREETEKYVRRGNIPESTQVGITSKEVNQQALTDKLKAGYQKVKEFLFGNSKEAAPKKVKPITTPEEEEKF